MMKKLITLLLAALSMFVMTSCCQTKCGSTADGGLFDGSWKLVQLGDIKFSPTEQNESIIVIKENRTYEDNIENGRIEKIDGQYYLIEKISGKKFPCELTSLMQGNIVIHSLTVHTAKDDPDFNGNDIIYQRVEQL